MKKQLIIITGTPGTGKSTLARFLESKLNFDRLDLHHYYSLISSGYDSGKKCYVIDKKKLLKLVNLHLLKSKKGLIVDSHVSHYLSSSKVDLCLVLVHSDLKELQRRLKKRRYSPVKIRENLDAEIFQVCQLEALEKKHHIIIFDTAKDVNKNILMKVCKELGKRL